MARRPPVEDWSIDFDPMDPAWSEDPFPLWEAIRGRCPVATSQRFEGGAYFPIRYDDIYAIAYDTEHFSSRRIVVRAEKLPVLGMPPITSDPPEHTPARKLLLPPFSPKAVATLEPMLRASCRTLLDRIGTPTSCDAAIDYAQHVPVQVIAHMLGVDAQDGDRFREWIQRFAIETEAMGARAEADTFFAQQLDRRRANPGDDLVSYLLRAEIDGQPLTERHLLGTLNLILIAGIDTTWSALGASLWHLATHAEDRRRLAAEPTLLPTAIEEFLRAYAPVTMAREVVKDTTVGGCPFKAEGQVVLSFPAANRDPAKFAQPERVLIDRAENPHAAFGLGRHRCLGSNLARLELTVALEEWLVRFPEFELRAGARVAWSEGSVRGPRTVPVTFPGHDAERVTGTST